MDTTMTDGLAGAGWAEVEACTLPTAARPLRLAEFDELFATALRSIEHPGRTHARLLLMGGAGLAERARRLADAESSCCSFFTFGVTALQGGQVAFDIEVPTANTDVLAGLVTRAAAVLGRTS